MASVFSICTFLPLIIVAVVLVSIFLLIVKRVMGKVMEFDNNSYNGGFMDESEFYSKDVCIEKEHFHSKEGFAHDETPKQYCSYCHSALPSKSTFGLSFI